MPLHLQVSCSTPQLVCTGVCGRVCVCVRASRREETQALLNMFFWRLVCLMLSVCAVHVVVQEVDETHFKNHFLPVLGRKGYDGASNCT